jgi:putative oxidoreductase
MSLLGFREYDLAALVLRLVIGALFILHGWPKIKDPRKPAAWVKSTGWTWAAGFAYPFTVLEFLGGIALVIGFLTPIVALLFVLEMIATTIFARAKLGKKLMGGWETDLLFLGAALALVFLGAGAWSIDALLGL